MLQQLQNRPQLTHTHMNVGGEQMTLVQQELLMEKTVRLISFFKHLDYLINQSFQACFWPWQAALLEKKGLAFEVFCGGVIYNEEWIITTAACVDGKDLEAFEVIYKKKKRGHNISCKRLKLESISSVTMNLVNSSDQS